MSMSIARPNATAFGRKWVQGRCHRTRKATAAIPRTTESGSFWEDVALFLVFVLLFLPLRAV
ncbi:hypothetical protein ABE29_06215 [Cytobacillus firmus]|nr:hypothetical protein [Cytobacillus firmus]MBG9547143.1 hypothetical protein [Cytobacillus firmus]MBG9558349.1 hypothetical protein [Cytobacillus firmus]MBG9573446.1 hypothetical protein [Cytobacillus firmus]